MVSRENEIHRHRHVCRSEIGYIPCLPTTKCFDRASQCTVELFIHSNLEQGIGTTDSRIYMPWLATDAPVPLGICLFRKWDISGFESLSGSKSILLVVFGIPSDGVWLSICFSFSRPGQCICRAQERRRKKVRQLWVRFYWAERRSEARNSPAVRKVRIAA
jgi:hypothetical protein